MRLGIKEKLYDKELDSILVHRHSVDPFSKKKEITTDDLVRFDGIEAMFTDTLQRAIDKKKVKVSGLRSLFDLNHPDHAQGPAVIAVVQRVERVNKRRLSVAWENPATIGRFEYCKNGVDDVLIRLDGEDFTAGPDSDKAIVLLLEQLGKPISKKDLIAKIETKEGGVKQMILRINKAFQDATMTGERLVVFDKGYLIKSW